MRPTGYTAHPSAIVENGAAIGGETSIWHHAHVRSGATIGVGCVVGKNAYIDVDAVVGNRVKIQNNISVYAGVTIGDDVFIGPSVVFTNDLVPRAFNEDWTPTKTYVDRGASIGANATIVCGNTIGEFAMAAAGSVVTRDVEPHQLVAGNPARHRGWVCQCGAVVSRDEARPPVVVCLACHEGAL